MAEQTIILNVTTAEDQNDGSTFRGLSLRDAILIANADPENHYEINLPSGTYDLTIKNVLLPPISDDGNNTVDQATLFQSRLSTGDLDITGNVTIIGDGKGNTIINAGTLTDSTDEETIIGDRVFDVISSLRSGKSSNGNLEIQNVTIKNGTITEDNVDALFSDGTLNGGAINIDLDASATFINSIIADSKTTVQGGGINNSGTLTLDKTIVRGHNSGDNAGGIYNTGTLTIRNSAIIDNLADAAVPDIIEGGGGGILNEAGATLILVNSTVSGNKSASDDGNTPPGGPGDGGGGILSRGITRIINSTIFNNSAQVGSGIYSETLTANTILYNTIVGNNDSEESPDLDGFFDARSAYNLVSNANGSILDANNNNIVGGDTTQRINLNIGPLENNGGGTPTHALLSGSLAINRGDNSMTEFPLFFPEDLPITDQRGLQRIADGTIDIGAYEFRATAVTSIPPTDTNSPDNNNNGGVTDPIDVDETDTDNNSGVDFPDTQESDDDSLLNAPIFRFQNTSVSGTYLYAGSEEAQSIRSNFSNFTDEGIAFNVSEVAGDDLIAMYRFQNTAKPGTYLLAGEEERQSILRNNRNFVDEGIAFYVYGADANKGDDIYRFQSVSNSGTYLFVGEAEKNNIVANFSSSFRLEGVAFEVG
jgi:hypothetical protein